MGGSKGKKQLLVLLIITTLTIVVKAQSGLALYPFDDFYNSSNYNPAYLSSSQKFTLSFFPIGGTSIGYNNQKVIKNLLANVLKGNISDNTYRQILKSMLDRKLIHQNIESNFLMLTYQTKYGFLNFRIKENESFYASAKGDITSFILKDEVNSVVIGEKQKLPAQIFHYREYSVGYSFKSPLNRFYGGIRAKLYFGKAAMYSDIEGVILKGVNGDYTLNTTGAINISFPETTYNSEDGTPKLSGQSRMIKYLLNSGNPGLGIDLGFKYRLSPNLSLSLSVIDWGRIKWKTNLSSKYLKPYNLPVSIITNVEGDGVYEKITKTDYSISEDMPEYVEDGLTKPTFSSPLPMSIFLSAKYQLKKDLAINLVGRNLSSDGLNIKSLMASATFNVNNYLTINSGYSIIGNSLFNFPMALLYKGNFGQMYLSSDNLASLFFPSLSEFEGISFGTSFYLFKNRNLYRDPTTLEPFHRPKKKWSRQKNGLIRKAFPEN